MGLLADMMGRPKSPTMPGAAPSPADPSVDAIRKAKLMERRRQLGLVGDQSTWLTGARGDTNQPEVATKTLLGE